MEPYKAKKLPIEFTLNKELVNLLSEVEEVYGEYKGYLKNMNYDYKTFYAKKYVTRELRNDDVGVIHCTKEEMDSILKELI